MVRRRAAGVRGVGCDERLGGGVVACRGALGVVVGLGAGGGASRWNRAMSSERGGGGGDVVGVGARSVEDGARAVAAGELSGSRVNRSARVDGTVVVVGRRAATGCSG